MTIRNGSVLALCGIAILALLTWHPFFAGGMLLLAGIVWHVTDIDPTREIEKYANDDHDR